MLRELKGWTQAELANRCGISATNISLLENNKFEIGKRRVEQIAKAFDVHPVIIMFPEYEGKEIRRYQIREKNWIHPEHPKGYYRGTSPAFVGITNEKNGNTKN